MKVPDNLEQLITAIVMIPGYSLEKEAKELVTAYLREKFQESITAALGEGDHVLVASLERLFFKLTRG